MSLLDKFITDEGILTPKITEVFEKIFDSLDLDKDDALNLDELNQFAKKLNGEPFDQDSIDQILDNFELNEEGNLTKFGFIQLYELQTNSEPEETLKDLEKLGYKLEDVI